MSVFKDMVEADRDILINLDELAETHLVAGKEIKVVIDYDKLEDLKKGMNQAIGVCDLYFFAKSEDLPAKKGYGSTLNFDHTLYTVMLWEASGGVTEVALSNPHIS